MTTLRRLASCTGAVAFLAACDSPTPPETDGTAPTVTQQPTTGEPTEPGTACAPAEAPSSHEDAAQCLYAAFQSGDRDRAAEYATEAAVEDMFALGGYPTDSEWSFEGCGEPRESTPSSGVACHYDIPGEVHGVAVELAMRDDLLVESVTAVG